MSNIVLKKNQVNNSVIPNLRDAISNLNLAYNKLNQLNIPSDFIQKTYLNNVKNNIDEMRKNLTRYTNNIKNIVTKINNIENKNQNFNNANNNYNNKTINKSNSNIKPSLVSNTFVNRAFAEQNKMTSTKINKNGFSFQSIIDNIKNPNKLKENIKNGFNSLQKFYKDNKDTINTALIVIAALKSGGNKKENNYPDNAEKIAKDMTNSIISNMKDGKILINSALNGKGGLKDTYSTVWNGITNTANAALNGKGGLKDTYSGVLNSIANNELVKNTASGWNIILTNPGRSGENLKIAGDWALNGKNGLKDSIEHPDIWLSNIGMTAAGFTFGLAKGIESVADGLLKSGGMVVKGGLSIYDLVRGDLNLSTVKNYDEILNQVISYDSTKVYEDMYFSNDNVKIMEKESVIKKDSEGYLLSKIVGGVASNIILLSGTSVVASSSVSSAAALVSGISSFGGNFENEINKNTIDLKYGTNDLSLNIDYNTLQIIKDLKVGHSTTITQTLPTSNGGSIELKLNIKSLGNGKYDITDQYGNKVEFKDFNEANVTKAEIVSLIKGGRDAALYYAGAKVNEAQFEPLVGGIKNSLLKTTAQSGIRVTLDALSGAVTVPSDTAITMIADNKSLEEAWEENGGTTAMINNIITGAGFSALSEAGNITSSFKGTKVASRINKEGFTAKNLDDISKLKGYELKSYVEESIKNGTFESTFKFINKQELDNIGKMFNKTDLQKITDTKLDYKIHIEDNILTSNLKDKITKEQLDYMKNLKGDDLEAFMNKATQLGKLKDVLNYLDENEVKRFENIIIEDNIKRHGYQLNIDDMGDFYKTKLKSGFFTEEQIKNMLNNINEKGYINKETGDHLKNLFDNKYDIYVKTVNSSDIDSIFENGVYCNGTSTSGFGMKPTSIKDIDLENTVTGIDCLYDMTVKVKSANGVSQGGNPIDGTIILKVPKGISKEDMLIKLQDGNYSINPKYIDSFIGVDNRGIVNDVVYNKTINSATKSPIKSSPDSITKNTEPKITNTSKISQEVGNIKSAAKGSKVANKIKVDGFTKETLDEISKLKGYGLKTYIEDSIKNGTFESTYKYINKQELNNIEKMFNKTDTQIINDTRIDYKIHLEDDILTTISSNKLTLEQYNYMKNLKGSELEGFINKASYFNKLNEVSNYLNEKEVSKVAPNLKGTKAGEELSNILNIKRIVENESNNLTADQKSIQESLNRFNNAKKYSDDLQIAIDYKDKTQYLFTRLEQLKETFNTKDLNECYNKFSDYSNSAKDPNAIYKVIKPYLPKEERLALSKLNIFNILGKNEYKNLHKLDDIFNFKSKLSEAEQKELYAYSKALGPVIGGYCRKCDVTFTVNSNGLSMTYKYKDSQKWYDVGCQRYNMKQKNISQAIEMIDGIIKKSPGLKEDTILYRGANGLYFDGSEVDLSSLKVGDIINDPAFVSTSISKDKFYDRSDIHIEILAPKGTEGAYIETFVGGYSQQEVLLKRDTNFKVISEPTPFKIVDGYGIERTKFKVILEIVPDEVADKFRLNNSKLNITTELPNHAIKNNVTTELPNNAIKNNVTTELPNNAIKNNVTAELPNHAIKHNLDIVNDLNLKTNKKISSEFNKYNNIFNKNITGVNVDEFIEKLQKKRLLMIYDESIQDINSIYSRGQKGVIHHDVEHVERVMLYSMYMGDELNLNTKEMSMLIDAAKYHDVGVYAGHKDHASRSAAEAMDKLKNNYSTEDLNKIAAVIKYHEVADMVNSNGTLIYDDSKFKNIMKEFNIPESEYDSLRKIALILKDADAIDRTRFKNNLDTRYFKNQDLANSLVKTSYQLQEIQAKKTLDENLRNGFYSENDKAIINNYRNEGVPDYIILESYSTWYMWPNKNGSRLYSSPNDMIEKWMKGI